MFSTYDQWKLATPPEYDWPEPEYYCTDCGALAYEACICDAEPDPDDFNDYLDAAADAR